MDPATAIIRKLGGEAKVAGIAGTALSAPYRWQHEKSRGGTGGLIPQAHHRRLLDYADAHGIALAAEEFLMPQARCHGRRRNPASGDGGPAESGRRFRPAIFHAASGTAPTTPCPRSRPPWPRRRVS